jgi:hypothetical protein
VEDEMP